MEPRFLPTRASQARRFGCATLACAAAVAGLFALRADATEVPLAAGAEDSCGLFDRSHAAWTTLLKRYVKNGVVDYAGLEQEGEGRLRAYLGTLQSVCRGRYDSWSRDDKLAFWINAYNAYTVGLVLDHYPLASIRDIGFLPGAAFRKRFIPLEGLRGAALSLDEIENEILRKEFAEPRIHFAIVCASKGCPALRSEAYRGADLDRQLDEAARAFIRDPAKNQLDGASHTLYLSPIFKWFREDFERAAGTLPGFVARYGDEPTVAALNNGGVRIEFRDYDWSLNGR